VFAAPTSCAPRTPSSFSLPYDSDADGAVDVELTDDQLVAIELAVPKGAAAGDRYDAAQMAMLDSER
jgi:hypothetical protein